MLPLVTFFDDPTLARIHPKELTLRWAGGGAASVGSSTSTDKDKDDKEDKEELQKPTLPTQSAAGIRTHVPAALSVCSLERLSTPSPTLEPRALAVIRTRNRPHRDQSQGSQQVYPRVGTNHKGASGYIPVWGPITGEPAAGLFLPTPVVVQLEHVSRRSPDTY
eukprot:1225026-Pyramimonas_sp.AAC.1